jgi:hypothetical protein
MLVGSLGDHALPFQIDSDDAVMIHSVTGERHPQYFFIIIL